MISSPISLTVVSTCTCYGLGHLNVPVRGRSFVTESFFRCPDKYLGALGHVIFRALAKLC